MVSIIDLLALGLLIYAGYRGFRAGFINMLFDVLSLSLSFYLTLRYYKVVGQFLQTTLHVHADWKNVLSWDNVLVWVLSFVLCFVALKLVGYLLTNLLNRTYLGAWNHYVGLILNVTKWLIMIWLVVIILMELPVKTLQDYGQKSVTYISYRHLASILPLKQLLPERLR